MLWCVNYSTPNVTCFVCLFPVLNVAAGKAPMQSSVAGGGVPERAVDGSTSNFFTPETCSLTEVERSPWWYVNLLEPYMVQLVRLDFGKPCCGTEISFFVVVVVILLHHEILIFYVCNEVLFINFGAKFIIISFWMTEDGQPATIVVRVGNSRPDMGVNAVCNRFTGFIEEGRPLFLPCNPPMAGAFVSVHLEGPAGNSLSICEAFVYTDQVLSRSFQCRPITVSLFFFFLHRSPFSCLLTTSGSADREVPSVPRPRARQQRYL